MTGRLPIGRVRLLSLGLSLTLLLQPTFYCYAQNITINASPANTGSYTNNNGSGGITVNADITQTNGIHGGTITLGATTFITVNAGRTLNVSATGAGGNGGTITLNAPAITVNGILRANGMGSGRGGTINLNGLGTAGNGNNYIRLGAQSVLEAKGGASNGLGGVVNIIGNGNTYVDLQSVTTGPPGNRGQATIDTSGVTAAGANEIYIQGDGSQNGGTAIDVTGLIYANATAGSGSSGGLIRFTTTDGEVLVPSLTGGHNVVIEAKGDGAGSGGTLDFVMSNGGGDFTFSSLLDVNTASTIDISGGGGTETGTLRFARSTAGDMTLDWDDIATGEFDNGVGTVYIGNWLNNLTANIESDDFVVTSDLNGGATLRFQATGDIDLSDTTNNFDTISVVSTGGGDIDIYDATANLTIDQASTSGDFDVEAEDGNLTISNATLSGDAILKAQDNIDASATSNSFTGNVQAYGDGGTTDPAASVNIYSSGDLTVTRLTAGTATLQANNRDLTVSNATVTGVSTLTARRHITATNTTNWGTNNHLTSTNGGDITVTDSTGNMTVGTLSTSGDAAIRAATGSLTVSGANMTGGSSTTTLQGTTFVDASNTGNYFNGDVAAYGESGTGDALTNFANIYSTGRLQISRVTTLNTTLTAAGGGMTITNAAISGTASLTASNNITGNATSNNFGSSTAATGNNINLRDNAGTFVLNGVTANGTLTLATASGVSMTLNNVDAQGAANISVGGGNADISGSTGNVFRSATVIDTNDDDGGDLNLTADWQSTTGNTIYADQALITDTAGDMYFADIYVGGTNSTFTASGANSNADVLFSWVVNGAGKATVTADKNIRMGATGGYTTTLDTIVLNSTNGGNIEVHDFHLDDASLDLVGRTTAQTGPTGGVWMGTNGGTITLTNVINDGQTNVIATNTISGTGNTFNDQTSFNAGASADITFTSTNFADNINAFIGDDVTLVDPTAGLTISSVTATNLSASATQNSTTADLTISNANVSTSSTLLARDTLTATASITDLGTITATAGTSGTGNLAITESSDMTINTVTNSSGSGTTTLTSTGGAITGKGTNVNDIVSPGTGLVLLNASSAGGYVSAKVNTGGDVTVFANGSQAGTGNSIYLYGTVGDDLIVRRNAGGADTTGHIIMGDWENPTRSLTVNDTTTFRSANDVLGYGTFAGTVTGNGNRVSFDQVGSTNFTVGTITANATGNAANEFWAGYGNVLNIWAENAAIVDDNNAGTVDLNAPNGGVTLWASGGNTSHIRTGIAAGGDVYMWTSGDTNGAAAGGTSINVQSGSIGGDIVAVDESWDKTSGDIIINLTSGNLTTKTIGTDGNLTLRATNGSILQNNAYGWDRDITVYATGNATIQAGDAAGDVGSYIDTGVYVQGNAVFIAAGKSGSNTSVTAVGRVDGNATVYDEGTNAVSGDVYLGKNLGSSVNNLNDDGEVLDVFGNIFVNALGNVYLNGGLAINGSITVYGQNVTIRQDLGSTKIANITTNSNGNVDIFNYGNEGIFGVGGGTNISTGAGNILLRAGNSYPADGKAYIDSLGVNTAGNLTVYVAGDSNGLSPGGVSVNITGSAGSSNAYNHTGGGAPTGSVSMP